VFVKVGEKEKRNAEKGLAPETPGGTWSRPQWRSHGVYFVLRGMGSKKGLNWKTRRHPTETWRNNVRRRKKTGVERNKKAFADWVNINLLLRREEKGVKNNWVKNMLGKNTRNPSERRSRKR